MNVAFSKGVCAITERPPYLPLGDNISSGPVAKLNQEGLEGPFEHGRSRFQQSVSQTETCERRFEKRLEQTYNLSQSPSFQ